MNEIPTSPRKDADEREGCPTCGGAGDLPDRQWLEAIVHLILIAGARAQAGVGGLHPWLATVPMPPDAPPSQAMTELSTGLAGRPPGLGGHDALDRCAATDAIVRAAGLDPLFWGMCPSCKGSGEAPAPNAL